MITMPSRKLVAEQRLYYFCCHAGSLELKTSEDAQSLLTVQWPSHISVSCLAGEVWRRAGSCFRVIQANHICCLLQSLIPLFVESLWGAHWCQSSWQQITLYIFFLGLSGNLQDLQAVQPAYTTWEMMHSGRMMGQNLHPNISHVSYYWFWA